VRYSCCEFPEKIPLYVKSNVSCFTSLSSGSITPKVAEIFRLCAWSILLLGPKRPLAHHSLFIVCPSITKNSFLGFLRTFTCSEFLKTQSLFQKSAHQAPGLCCHKFSSDSKLVVSTKKDWCFCLMFGEVEPSLRSFLLLLHKFVSNFKEFLDSTEMISLGLMSMKAVGYAKLFPAWYF
jgi:hypothetical protein